MKSDKRNIIISIVFVVCLLLIGISATYAFFSRKVIKNGEDSKTNVQTGVLNVDFLTNEYINNSKAELIEDSEIFTKADKSEFTVKESEESTADNVRYNLYLDIENISDEFKSEYVKWALYNESNPTSESVALSHGNFKDIGDLTKIKLNQTNIELLENETHSYTLYLWLSYSETDNQNELLQKRINVKVSVEAATY